MADAKPSEDYVAEVKELRARLEEAEDALRAIQNGEIDALITAGSAERQVRTEELQRANEELSAANKKLAALNKDHHTTNEALRTTTTQLLNEIEERKQAERQILQQNALVEGINRIFHETLISTEAELGSTCLAVAEEITGSKFGFIGEIDSTGAYGDIAVSDPGWNACQVIDPETGEKWLPTNMKIHGIYGRVMLDGKGFFTNDPPSHCDSIGTPEGHPPLTAFLGVPLMHQGKVIGMIGLGNREDGYREEDLELVEDLAPAIVEAFMRRRTEDALLESEQRFRSMADAIPQLAWMAQPDGYIFWYNHRWYEYTGTTAEQMAGWGWQSVHDPEMLPAVLERWKASIATGAPFDMEFPLLSAGGEFRWFLTRVMPLKDSEGRVTRWFGTNTDVSEKRQAESALRKSEESYRSLFDAMLEGFCIIEMIFDDENKPIDYRFLEINPAFESQTGLLNAQGKRMRELAPDTEEHWFEIYGRIALTGEPVRFVNEAAALGRWYNVSAYRVGGPDSRKVGVIFSDVTERHWAEQKIREAREELERYSAQLESFFTNMADAVVLLDADSHVLMVNDATVHLIGAPTDTPITDWPSLHKLFTLDGEPVPPEEYPARRALRGLATKDARFRMVTPWKESLVSISGSPVWDGQRQVVGGTLSFRDVARQVDLENYREELLQRERHISQVLQGSLVPQKLPEELYGCGIAVKYQSALSEAEVGGDFFDVFDLGGGKLGVIIGDVAGKGLKAAARVAEARFSVRSYAYEGLSPSMVLMRTNDILCMSRFEEGSMLTAFFAIVDTNTNRIIYSNAGHEPPIVIGTDCSWKEFVTTGMPLGVMGGTSYSDEVYELNPGDKIVMITDGISEARANGTVLFEKRGVIDYVVDHCETTPSQMIGGLLAAATEHAGGSLQDDAALVVFECGRMERNGVSINDR